MLIPKEPEQVMKLRDGSVLGLHIHLCRLLSYHVVADYEAEEDDIILLDAISEMLPRSQQWDNNIAAKVAVFTATFEKQVQAFNIITEKRNDGELRSEEKLMIE